jgi:hypothetical protein
MLIQMNELDQGFPKRRCSLSFEQNSQNGAQLKVASAKKIVKGFADKLNLIMADEFSDGENSIISSNDLDEVDGGGTDPEESLQVENEAQIKNSAKADFLLTPSEVVSRRDLDVIQDAMVTSVLGDTIRGIKDRYVELKEDAKLYERFLVVWQVFRNTRMYKGDFLGLNIAFRTGETSDH